MNILALTRPHTKPEVVDDPKGAAEAEAFQAGQPVRTVRHHATPGIGADVIAELRADAAATGPWDGTVLAPASPAALIEHALHMALAPIEALLDAPAKPWDFSERAFGIEARAYAHLSRLTADLTYALNVHEHAVVKPVIAAQRELLDVADFAVLDAVMVRQAFAAMEVAIEDAFVTHAAEWILAGVEEPGMEASTTGCCPECGGRFELDKGRVPTHYPTGDPRQCSGSGNEPEGSAR